MAFTGVSVQITLDGFNQYSRKSAGMLKSIAKGLRSAAEAGAEVIRVEIENRSPVDRGTLKDEQFFKTVSRKRRRVVVLIAAKKRAFYQRFLELGTINMDAQPHMRPAFEAKKEKAAKAVIGRWLAIILAVTRK